MKLFFLFLTTTLLLLVMPSHVAAVTATPSPKSTTPTITVSEKLNAQINELKEKIASRVSELNLVEKRGMNGTITQISGSKITMTDVLGKTRFVDIDEITKFSSASNKTFGLSDLTKGTKITVLGLYNKQSKRLLARFISLSIDPIFISGTITDIDTKNFMLTVTTKEKKQYKLDNQSNTKIYSFSDEELTRSGFSKLTLGDRITSIGFPDKKDPNLIVPNRIVVILSSSSGSETKSLTPTPTE